MLEAEQALSTFTPAISVLEQQLLSTTTELDTHHSYLTQLSTIQSQKAEFYDGKIAEL